MSEGISGQRSELRNLVDGSSSDNCGNGDGIMVIKDYRSHRRVPETESMVVMNQSTLIVRGCMT